MDRIRKMTEENTLNASDQAVAWLQTQLGEPHGRAPTEEESEKTLLLEQLHKQQEDLQRKINEARGEQADTSIGDTLRQSLNRANKDKSEQELLLEQIRTTLAPKAVDKDPNKALLRALITAQNKAAGYSGTSTLKPDMLNKLTGEGEFSMAEWLASLNKQEEAESEASKIVGRFDEDSDCRSECRHSKKSGMLDKSTANIKHKEVWPQKNLGEDWAEEEIKFKQLKFEHLVAGET